MKKKANVNASALGTASWSARKARLGEEGARLAMKKLAEDREIARKARNSTPQS